MACQGRSAIVTGGKGVGVVVGLGSLNDHHYAPPVASLRPGRCVKWRFGSRGLSVASKLCRAPQAAAFSSPHELQTLPETLSGPRPRHQYAHKHTQLPPQSAHMRARPHTIKKRFTASARAEYTPVSVLRIRLCNPYLLRVAGSVGFIRACRAARAHQHPPSAALPLPPRTFMVGAA